MSDLQPIVFRKKGDNFWSFDLSETRTERESWLQEVLHEQIGVNFSNADGWYYFNAVMVGERLVYSMTRIEADFAEQMFQIIQARSN